MRERIELLGGEIEVRSGTGAGTEVKARVPVRPG
jgi:signal transduction histidine kinase